MKRRILAAILGVTTLAIILFGLPLALVVSRLVNEETTLRLERQAVLISRNVPGDFKAQSDPVEFPPSSDGIMIGLYDPAGNLVSGNGPSHADAITKRGLKNEVADGIVGDARIVSVPVSASEAVVGAIRAQQSIRVSSDRTRRIVEWLGGLALGVLVIGTAIGYVIAERLARPARRLRDAAVQLGDGDFTIDMPRSNIPELDDAAQAMTATARRLDDLVARERSFSGDASHQLRTPLAGLRAAIETEIEFPRTDPTEVLRESLVDIGRLEQTITELLAIARSANSNGESLDVSEVLTDIDARWRARFTAAGRPLIITASSGFPAIQGRPVILRHALDVLVDNTLNHGTGAVKIYAVVNTSSVTITVSDEGLGFSPTSDNFSTLTESHGLGLMLAHRLVTSLPARLIFRTSSANPEIDIVLKRVVEGAT